MAKVPSPYTEFHDTPNKSVRQNVPRKGAVIHHGVVLSFEALLALEMGLKQVSSSAIAKDARAGRMFDEDGPWRAWSLSDAFWDSALRSVEACNETLAPDYTVSEATHRRLGWLVAWWAQKDGFWPHRDGDPRTWTVLGHFEVYTIHGGSYGTACPGGINLGYVTKIAQDLLRAGSVPNPFKENPMPAFMKGDAKPEIFYQREPKTPLISISEWEFSGYQAQGAVLKTIPQSAMNSILAGCGTAAKPEPTGGDVTTGDVTVDIDYAAMGAAVAKALLDEEARRLGNG